MRLIQENPDEADEILADLAVKGIIDNPSLAVATADAPDQIEVSIDAAMGPSKRRPVPSVSKSVDRRAFNEEFVRISMTYQ